MIELNLTKETIIKIRRIVALAALCLAISMIAFAGVQVNENNQIYYEGQAMYMSINDRIMSASVDSAAVSPDLYSEMLEGVIRNDTKKRVTERRKVMPLVEIPKLNINYKALRELNEDAAAWLYSPGAGINYPVMKAKDYSEYMFKLPDGSINANGSLFFDFHNAADMSSPLTIIYGHAMKSGKMFGNLFNYKNQSFFEQNPYAYVYTAYGNYRVDLMYGFTVEAGQWRERSFMHKENIDSLVSYASHKTTFKSPVEYTPGDRLVVLITCSYDFDDAHYAVMGVLRPEY